MFITSFGEQNITYKCCSNFLIHLSPHALVHDGYRWHVRAYCHKRKDFRDFLLSRVIQAQKDDHDIECNYKDAAWNKMVEVVIIAHPELRPAQRRLIESDYAMVNGEVRLECRQALLHYLLFQLNLTDAQAIQRPEAVQLALKNPDEILPLLQS